MIGGGTSAFPSWGLWLAAAIAATSITAIALLVFVLSHRVRNSPRGRILGALLVLASCVVWIGYRIESNQRWAARSLVLEAADAFDGTSWTEEGLLRVSTRATEGCAQDNGASAQRQLLIPGPSFSFADTTRAEYASALEQLDSATRRLESLGFSLDRKTVRLPSGLRAIASMTRGDEAIRIETAGRRLHIYGAANECNSDLLLARMERNDLVDVADYSIESVCGADLPERPDHCQEPN